MDGVSLADCVTRSFRTADKENLHRETVPKQWVCRVGRYTGRRNLLLGCVAGTLQLHGAHTLLSIYRVGVTGCGEVLHSPEVQLIATLIIDV